MAEEMTATECLERQKRWCDEFMQKIIDENRDTIDALVMDEIIMGRSCSKIEGFKIIRIPPEEWEDAHPLS